MDHHDIKMKYKSGKFDLPHLQLVNYQDDFFKRELDLESELFYEFRKNHGWKPTKINESTESELLEIKKFFNEHKETFLFHFINDEIAGSILYIGNYINSLCIDKKFQQKGFGTLLTKHAVNKIIDSGYQTVLLNVFPENIKAINMYRKIGFVIQD